MMKKIFKMKKIMNNLLLYKMILYNHKNILINNLKYLNFKNK